MSDENKKPDPTNPGDAPGASDNKDNPSKDNPIPPADPLKDELKKVEEKKEKRSKREKLLYTKKRVEQQLEELGDEEGDELSDDTEDDDDKPVTVGMLKKQKLDEAVQTALTLADAIQDETERALTKHHLTDTIKPSGNPQQDLANARAIVNSLKNKQIAEEAARGSQPKSHGSGSGAPAKPADDTFVPTPEEANFMRPPFNLSKEQIIAARKKEGKS